MKKNKRIRFPAEYEPHLGTLMIWPERPGSWGKDASGAEAAFTEIISELLKVEQVFLLVSEQALPAARQRLEEKLSETPEAASGMAARLSLIEMETDDAWARDVGPTFVLAEDCTRLAVNWRFNAWGGEVDGLYARWDKDDAAAKRFAAWLGDEVLDADPFVLEGGSIHTDGEGTLMVTESCLLSPGRNPQLDKAGIEAVLKKYLGVEKILWLPRGIWMDETNEHVDNVAAFVGPGEVVKVTKDGEIISGDLSVGGIAATDNKGGFNIVELSSDGAETLKRFDVAFVNDGAKYDFALQVMQQDLGYIEI